jgi:membrane protease YdiL (CAAX protease family)
MTPEDEPQAEQVEQAEPLPQPQAGQPEPTEPVPPPVKPERIWPVWVAYAVALAGSVAMGIGVFAIWFAGELASGTTIAPAEVSARYQGFIFTTVGMSLAVVFPALVFLTTALVAAKLDGSPIRERLSLGWGRAQAPQALGAVAALLGTSIALGALVELLQFGQSSTLRGFASAAANASPTGLILFTLLVTLAGAIEEVFFRGLMQRPLVRRWGRWGGILATAAAFALMHMDLAHGFVAFFMGVLLGWLAERAEGIAPAMVAHAFNNAFAALSVPVFVALGDVDPINQLAFGLAAALAAIVSLRRSFASGVPALAAE